jgi:pyrimidine-nucleoside phosphorylase
MTIIDLIAKTRDQIPLTRAEFDRIATGAAQNSTPDYQLAAWLMATYLNGLTDQETADLTLAMAESGDRIDLTGLPKPWVDKHSTGGVGDKTTIVLLPLLAACGLTVVKMSGPGLGKTGGTIDKLASIPGFRTDLSPEEMKAQAREIGLALTGQTPALAPADKALYTLRDVTATVPSLPLIVSSILSKKIAGGAEVVTLDVKCGRGAFMQTPEQATELAQALERVGNQAGLKIKTVVTDMDQPLGRTAGNALEVKEAIRILQNREHGRFRDLCLYLAKVTLTTAGISADPEAAIESGAALDKMCEWVAAQGGSLQIFESENWQTSPFQHEVVHSGDTGFIESINSEVVGLAVVELGGGRKTKADIIDHTVGIETLVEVGDPIRPGQPLFRIHATTSEFAAHARDYLSNAITSSIEPVQPRPIIL